MLVDRIQHLVPTAGGGDDGVGIGGPDERFGALVVLGEVAVDGGLEVRGPSMSRKLGQAVARAQPCCPAICRKTVMGADMLIRGDSRQHRLAPGIGCSRD